MQTNNRCTCPISRAVNRDGTRESQTCMVCSWTERGVPRRIAPYCWRRPDTDNGGQQKIVKYRKNIGKRKSVDEGKTLNRPPQPSPPPRKFAKNRKNYTGDGGFCVGESKSDTTRRLKMRLKRCARFFEKPKYVTESSPVLPRFWVVRPGDA